MTNKNIFRDAMVILECLFGSRALLFVFLCYYFVTMVKVFPVILFSLVSLHRLEHFLLNMCLFYLI